MKKHKSSIGANELSCSPQFDKMAENLVKCTQYQTNRLNPELIDKARMKQVKRQPIIEKDQPDKK